MAAFSRNKIRASSALSLAASFASFGKFFIKSRNSKKSGSFGSSVLNSLMHSSYPVLRADQFCLLILSFIEFLSLIFYDCLLYGQFSVQLVTS